MRKNATRQQLWYLIAVLFGVANLLASSTDSSNVTSMYSKYKGALAVGNTQFVYGSYSKIIRTEDDGLHWRDCSINVPFSDVVAMVTRSGSTLCYLSDGSVYQYDEVKQGWERERKLPFADLVDVYFDETTNNSVLLTSDSLYFLKTDYSVSQAVKVSAKSSSRISSGTDYYYITLDSSHLAVFQKGDLSQHQMIDLRIVADCGTCSVPSAIVSANSKIYTSVNGNLLESEPSGSAWKILFPCEGVFVVRADTIVTLTQVVLDGGLAYMSVSIDVWLHDGSTWKKESSLVPTDTLYTAQIWLSSVVTVGRRMYALGDGCQILQSTSDLTSWNWISYLPGPGAPKFFDGKVGYIYGTTHLYHTLDSGVTWLPQRFRAGTLYKGFSPNFKARVHCLGESIVAVVSNEGQSDDKGQANILCSWNNGLDIVAKTNRELFLYINQSQASMVATAKSVFIVVPKTGPKGTMTSLIFLNDSLETEKTVTIDSVHLYEAAVVGGDSIIAFAWPKRNIDSNGYIYLSIDGGMNWKSVMTMRDVGDTFIQAACANSIYFFTTNTGDPNCTFCDDWLRIGYYNARTGQGSGNIHADSTSYMFCGLGMYANKFWIGGTSYFFVCDDLQNKPAVWRRDSIFPGRENRIAYSDAEKMIVQSIVLNSGASHRYATLVMKPTKGGTSAVAEKIESVDAMFVSPPFPNPTTQSLSCSAVWNKACGSPEAVVRLYTASGESVGPDLFNVTINQKSVNSVQLSMNCSQLTNGAYFLHVKIGESECVRGFVVYN